MARSSDRKDRREVGTRDLDPERDEPRMEEPVGSEPDEFVDTIEPGDQQPPPAQKRKPPTSD